MIGWQYGLCVQLQWSNYWWLQIEWKEKLFHNYIDTSDWKKRQVEAHSIINQSWTLIHRKARMSSKRRFAFIEFSVKAASSEIKSRFYFSKLWQRAAVQIHCVRISSTTQLFTEA